MTVGDGHEVNGVDRGVMILTSLLPSDRSKRIKVQDLLHVPKLSYNLSSVSVATWHEIFVKIDKTSCAIRSMAKTSLLHMLSRLESYIAN